MTLILAIISVIACFVGQQYELDMMITYRSIKNWVVMMYTWLEDATKPVTVVPTTTATGTAPKASTSTPTAPTSTSTGSGREVRNHLVQRNQDPWVVVGQGMEVEGETNSAGKDDERICPFPYRLEL